MNGGATMGDEPRPVTSDDVQGLRVDTRDLTASVERLAARQERTEARVDTKADRDTVAAIAELQTGRKWNRRLAVLALLLVLVGFAWAVRNNSDRLDADSRSRTDARVQSCNIDNARLAQQRASFADVSNAIKVGAAAVLVTPPDATPEQVERTARAVDAYNSAVDTAIASAVAKVPADNSGVSCKLLGR